MELDLNKSILIEVDGQEKEMEILFTFHHEQTGRDYVFIYDPQDEDDQIYVYRYYEDQTMEEVEDEEEFAMCNEVFLAFVEEDDDEQEA